MLQRMCSFTKLDRISNERIGGTTKVWKISNRFLASRLKWYLHVMRRGTLRRKEGDRNGSTREKEERKEDSTEDGWRE